MYEYAVSFTIKSDAGYNDRYDSLMDQIRAVQDGYAWEETTSFALVRSPEKIDEFADRLYFNSSIDASKDILLVFDHINSIAIARGPIQYPNTLKSHFQTCVLK